jgi:CubicO group peptidase (beta-lactamase class C family)
MLVARHDQVACLACVGWRDIEAGRPMEPDSIFRIASMTKPIVSVAALMLIEAGKLRLEDPVSRYIPEFADVQVFQRVEDGHVRLAALERPITVYHLLTHTSGLDSDAPDPALEAAFDNLGDMRYGLPELMRRVAAHPLAHQPGEGWRYGWSHTVLGRVIEVAADRPLDEYLASAIFTPLGMVDSGFYVPPDKAERLAAVYESVAGALRQVDNSETKVITEHVPLLSGGGGCASTVPTTCASPGFVAESEPDGFIACRNGRVDDPQSLHAPPAARGDHINGHATVSASVSAWSHACRRWRFQAR